MHEQLPARRMLLFSRPAHWPGSGCDHGPPSGGCLSCQHRSLPDRPPQRSSSGRFGSVNIAGRARRVGQRSPRVVRCSLSPVLSARNVVDPPRIRVGRLGYPPASRAPRLSHPDRSRSGLLTDSPRPRRLSCPSSPASQPTIEFRRERPRQDPQVTGCRAPTDALRRSTHIDHQGRSSMTAPGCLRLLPRTQPPRLECANRRWATAHRENSSLFAPPPPSSCNPALYAIRRAYNPPANKRICKDHYAMTLPRTRRSGPSPPSTIYRRVCRDRCCHSLLPNSADAVE